MKIESKIKFNQPKIKAIVVDGLVLFIPISGNRCLMIHKDGDNTIQDISWSEMLDIGEQFSRKFVYEGDSITLTF